VSTKFHKLVPFWVLSGLQNSGLAWFMQNWQFHLTGLLVILHGLVFFLLEQTTPQLVLNQPAAQQNL
jgi:hypothetical protein